MIRKQTCAIEIQHWFVWRWFTFFNYNYTIESSLNNL